MICARLLQDFVVNIYAFVLQIFDTAEPANFFALRMYASLPLEWETQILRTLPLKMTGGTPEVRSDKSLTLLTFDIQPMDQWTNSPMDQWTMDQLTNGPIDQWTNGS